MPAAAGADFGSWIGAVAAELCGTLNARLSSKTEHRYGTNGSLAIDLTKGTFYDHESKEGGGTLDLIERYTGRKGGERIEWLREHGFSVEERQPQRTSSAGHEPKSSTSGAGKRGKIIATYDYTDEMGDMLRQVCRLEPKTFLQRRPDASAKDGWSWKVKGVREVPYRLPELAEAIAAGKMVCIVEGEKDANTLWDDFNVPATCNAGGALKWRDELSDEFSAADIVIIPDNDKAGHEHANQVAASLWGKASRVRIMLMPAGKDVTEWKDKHGGTREAFDKLVAKATDWQSAEEASRAPAKTWEEFLRDFKPPDWLMGGILQHRFFYSLTARTGDGKTSLMLLIAMHVALGRPLAGCEVRQGRVLYFAGENPDDVRMRCMAMRKQYDIKDDIPIYFVPGRFPTIKDETPTGLEKMAAIMKEQVAAIGEFSLVLIDTSAAYFEGVDENSNTEARDHARKLRAFTELAGGPTIIAACHPVKNATDDNLQPRGGGAFLAEVDGNLTVSRNDKQLTLSTQGKFRGQEFNPLSFILESIKLDQTDTTGGYLWSVIVRSLTEEAQKHLEDTGKKNEAELLKAIQENPGASQRELARILQWFMSNGEPYQQLVKRAIDTLRRKKLIDEDNLPTEKGRKALAKAAGSNSKPKNYYEKDDD